jgi:hypothetical protein
VAYSAFVWMVVFDAFQVYWGLGGRFGFGDQPDPLPHGDTAGQRGFGVLVLVLFVLGTALPLAMVQRWGRWIPLWVLVKAALTCDHNVMGGLFAWIRVVLSGGRPLPSDQLNSARRREVGVFAYQQAELLREGTVTHAEAVEAIANRFPELDREQATRALSHGLYESIW